MKCSVIISDVCVWLEYIFISDKIVTSTNICIKN